MSAGADDVIPPESSDRAGPTEAELRAILAARTGPIAALFAGVGLAARTASVGIPAALVYTGISAGVGWYAIGFGTGLLERDPASVSLIAQGAGGLFFFLILYTLIQVPKRATASRASWAPSLFAIPSLLVMGACLLATGGQANGIQPLIPSLIQMAWVLVWATFGGAAVLIVWLRAAKMVIDGGQVATGEIMAETQQRALEVSGPHGARIQLIALGMQVILPGIFYTLSLAFADMIAVLDPDKPALQRSGRLTWGMRGRLFRMFLLYWVVMWAVSMGIAILLDGGGVDLAGRVTELFMNPTGAPFPVLAAQELVWTLGTWVVTLSLFVLYQEREGQVRAKRALKAMKEATSEAPSKEKTPT